MTKSLLRVLSGEAVWPPPIWLMRQAGRYLPEYRSVRAKAGSFLTLALTPALASEVTLQPVRRFGFDAAILFSDILIVPWALGHALTYAEGEGPVMPPLRDRAVLRGLDPARLGAGIAPVLKTTRLVGERLAAEHPGVALIGFAGAPFTVACYMVEGRGSREFMAARRLAYTDSGLFCELIEMLTAATVTYLRGQIEAGAEVVQLFDSWAGLLPPPLFRRYVIDPARRITAALRESHPAVKIIGFPRLAGLMLAEYAARTEVDGVGVDTSTDLAQARGLVPERMALQGNLNPLALAAGGRAMSAEVASSLSLMRGRPYVFNLGHGIVPDTPPEHVARLVEQVRGG